MSVNPVPALWRQAAQFLDPGLVVTVLVTDQGVLPVLLIDPAADDARLLQQSPARAEDMSPELQLFLADELHALGVDLAFIPGLSVQRAQQKLVQQQHAAVQQPTRAQALVARLGTAGTLAAFGVLVGFGAGSSIEAETGLIAEGIGAVLGGLVGGVPVHVVGKELDARRQERRDCYAGAFERTETFLLGDDMTVMGVMLSRLTAAAEALVALDDAGLATSELRDRITVALGAVIRGIYAVDGLTTDLYEAESIVYAVGSLDDSDVQSVVAEAERLRSEVDRQKRAVTAAARKLFEAIHDGEAAAVRATAQVAAASYRHRKRL